VDFQIKNEEIMARFFLLFFIVALSAASAAAEDYYIELRPPEKAWVNAGFYVKDVIDGRKDTSDIGFALTGAFNKNRSARFPGGLVPTIRAYFGGLLPEDNASAPVVVKVLDLEVWEKSGFTGEYAMCRVKLSFYRAADDSLEYLFTAGDYRKRSGMDVTGFHEGHIRAGLDKCLSDFNAWMNGDTTVAGTAVSRPESLDTLSANVPLNKQSEQSSSIIGIGYLGANSSCGGLAYGRLAVKKRWCPVWTVGLLYRSIEYETEQDLYTGDLVEAFQTFGAAYRFKTGNLGLKLEVSIPFGWERIQYGDGSISDPKFYIGLALSQMLTTLPAKRGLFIAFGPIERAQANSKAYPWDIGAAVQVGYQW
jgi:hypothetical protein